MSSQVRYVKSKWYWFYANRINSGYQNYFEDRYKVMIDYIANLNDVNLIREEGVGIGSLTKALKKDLRTIRLFHGFDNDPFMIELCKKNSVGSFPVYMDNILEPKVKAAYDLALTHGVLEHFSDQDIMKVINRHNDAKKRHIHYVPTNKYDTPSFGDERLLSPKYWLNLTKPKDYILFNNSYDLLLIF